MLSRVQNCSTDCIQLVSGQDHRTWRVKDQHYPGMYEGVKGQYCGDRSILSIVWDNGHCEGSKVNTIHVWGLQLWTPWWVCHCAVVGVSLCCSGCVTVLLWVCHCAVVGVSLCCNGCVIACRFRLVLISTCPGIFPSRQKDSLLLK